MFIRRQPFYFFNTYGEQGNRFSSYQNINLSKDSSHYYHSTGAMNPMKLTGIMTHGILSKRNAEDKDLLIDSNGLGCNGDKYVS